jgi:hypothetical protein
MRPTLVVNPSTDAVFVRFARRILDDGLTSITEYERRLQVKYPRAVAHPRLLSSEPVLIWYVYRDGHWTGPGPAPEITGGQEPDAQP